MVSSPHGTKNLRAPVGQKTDRMAAFDQDVTVPSVGATTRPFKGLIAIPFQESPRQWWVTDVRNWNDFPLNRDAESSLFGICKYFFECFEKFGITCPF